MDIFADISNTTDDELGARLVAGGSDARSAFNELHERYSSSLRSPLPLVFEDEMLAEPNLIQRWFLQ